MNLVPEHIDEAIKYMPGRSEEELEKEWMKRISEIAEMNGEEAITAVYSEIRDNVEAIAPVSRASIANQLFNSVSKEQRKEAIFSVMNDYFFG